MVSSGSCLSASIGYWEWTQETFILYLIDELSIRPITILVPSIAPRNADNVAVSENFELKKADELPKASCKFFEFVDVGCWELIL